MDEKQPENGSRQRIDKWLFFARMAKSRSIAQSRIVSGQISVNDRKISQPSHMVKPGDRIGIADPRRDVVLLVRQAGVRRGPYEEARQLYDDLTPPENEQRVLSLFELAARLPGSGRPTKKERRALDRLRPDEPWGEE
ncbi:MAG: RNA-binding S4 domain-containing protein [Allorhizobium sp.]